MDERDLQGGEEWPRAIQDALRAATLVLVVIQKKRDWLAVDDEGNRRIDDAHDWVRREVALALREKTAIPVLLGDGGGMPTVEGLPDPLKSLPDKQALSLRQTSWVNDLRILVQRVGAILAQSAADGPADDADHEHPREDLPANIQYYLHCLATETETLTLLGMGRSFQVELPIAEAFVPLRATLARSLEERETPRFHSGLAEYDENVDLG